MPKITTIWAFIATDKAPDDEGVVAARVGDAWMPLVGADMERVNSLRPVARAAAKRTGQKITLAKFEIRTDIESYDPRLISDYSHPVLEVYEKENSTPDGVNVRLQPAPRRGNDREVRQGEGGQHG